jgi:hypothetical protein
MNNDLISRSALLGGYDVRKVTEYDESGCGLEYKAVPVEAIEAAPAVDAEPVRHGRWIQSKTVPSYHSCSYCKRPHNMPKSCNVYVLPYYCMDCGAKMDAEVGKRGSDD